MVDPKRKSLDRFLLSRGLHYKRGVAVGGILLWRRNSVLNDTNHELPQPEYQGNRIFTIIAGGIVGYADTLYVYSCSNNGTIKGAASTTVPPETFLPILYIM